MRMVKILSDSIIGLHISSYNTIIYYADNKFAQLEVKQKNCLIFFAFEIRREICCKKSHYKFMILCNKFLLSKDKNQSQCFPPNSQYFYDSLFVLICSLSGSFSNTAKIRTNFSELTENKVDMRIKVLKFLLLYYLL